jgi:hypothetical protein
MGVDLFIYRRTGALKPLWEEIKEVQNQRNRTMHRADNVKPEEAEKAIAVAPAVLEDLFQSLIQRLGFHLHEGSHICNDWHCEFKKHLKEIGLDEYKK